ncbi:MAG: hypothetical protein K9K82_10485 [Desulfobacteraceae bacterium]|nr:hypothetical protein [Desulfobacteraceae bacterium]
MNSKKERKDIKTIIASGVAIWLFLTILLYVITKDIKGIYAISILVLIGVLRFIIPEYIIQWRRKKSRKEKQ